MLPIAEKMDTVGFWTMEVWGGATFRAADYLEPELEEARKNIRDLVLRDAD